MDGGSRQRSGSGSATTHAHTVYRILIKQLLGQDLESVYMEAGASPLLRGGGRRYQSVPTADHPQDDTPVLSTEEQKKEMNKRKRVVMKGGITNVSYKNISKKRRRYISDLFTTLLGKRHFVSSSYAGVGAIFVSSSYAWVGAILFLHHTPG